VAWRRLEDFEERSKLSTWLHQIAYNTARRAIAKRTEVLTDDGIFDVTDEAISPMKRMRREERADLMRRATEGLPDLEREAIYLRYAERLPVDAITRILELKTKSGARGLLQKCKRHLEPAIRAELEKMGEGSSFLHTSRS
jgi:RNA polymerase sigma-70 factor (ECF subfamily)